MKKVVNKVNFIIKNITKGNNDNALCNFFFVYDEIRFI